MKTSILKTVLFIIILAVSVFARNSSSDGAAAASKIKFQLVNNFMVVVKIQINQELKYFLIDTGATTSVLDSQTMNDLGLQNAGSTSLQTVANATKVNWTRATIKFGNITFPDAPLLVADLTALKAHFSQLDGIIGNSLLRSFNYFIDYDKKELNIETVNEIGSALCGEKLYFKLADDRMILNADSSAGKRALVIDSASEAVILFADKGTTAAIAPSQILYTANGAAQYQKTDYRFLLGKITFTGEAVSLDRQAERAEDGLLPTILFKRIYVNNQHSYVMLDPISPAN